MNSIEIKKYDSIINNSIYDSYQKYLAKKCISSMKNNNRPEYKVEEIEKRMAKSIADADCLTFIDEIKKKPKKQLDKQRKKEKMKKEVEMKQQQLVAEMQQKEKAILNEQKQKEREFKQIELELKKKIKQNQQQFFYYIQQKVKEEDKELNEQILKAKKARQQYEKIQKSKRISTIKVNKKDRK